MCLWRIENTALHHRTSGRCHYRLRDVVGPKNVEHGLAAGEQVIRDDPPVAAPPDRLGAHDRGWSLTTKLAQASEAGVESVGERVIGIIPKAPVFPKRVLGNVAAA